MLKFYTFCLLLFCCTFAFSQGSLKGKLVDSVGKQSLKDASITVLDPRDSTLEVFGLAKDDGSFEIKNITFGTYLVHISFQGYEPTYRTVSFTKTVPDALLGNVYLVAQSHDLGNVTVMQSPVRLLHDTLEFNAGSFKTKPNAVAEDLFKKLPGMDVDKNGVIKAGGETVQRILVDGKRFFGDDPKMASKNLPPDIIDKIQVFDDLSDQSKFTGFDDGNRVKTINITTKKDKRKGYFGKGVAGAGTDETYDENFNLHRINGNQQLSLLGQGNDINKQNFTVQDVLGGGGGARGGRGGGGGGSSTGSGITTTWAAGLNYRDTWWKDADVSGSYFYNSQHTATDIQSHTQNIISPDSSTFYDQAQNSIRNNKNHRINLNLEQKLDSNNSIVFRTNLSTQTTTPFSNSTTTVTDDKGNFINNSTNTNFSTNTGYSLTGTNFQFRHRFNKKYRTASIDFNFSASKNDGDGFLNAINHFFTPVASIDTINQHYINPSNAFSFSPTFSYTEPLGNNQILELNYNYTLSKNNSTNNTYELNNATHGYTTFDSLFSNSYNFSTFSNRATLNYRIQRTKFNFSVGSGIQFTDQTSVNTTKNITVIHDYTNLTPTANFQFNFTKTKNLRINYTGRTGQPSISQLQPLTTTSDSINFQVGNPNLKPQFTHSLRFLYQSFDPITQHILLVTINASAITNDIQNSVIQNPNGGKTTTYVNLDGTYSLAGYFNYGFPLRNPKSNLNFTTNVNYSQAQTLINHASDFTRNTSLQEVVKWTTNLKNNFDMNFSATTTYNIIRNTLQPTQNSDYYTEGITAEATYYTNGGFILATDFDYTYSGNHAPGYNTSVPLLNPSVAYQFLKNKAGELRLSVFDLLNQNVSVTRTVSGNTITDQRTNVLTRYAMLTFTYNLRQFAGRQQRMPSPLRGMFRGGGQRPAGGNGGNNGGGRTRF